MFRLAQSRSSCWRLRRARRFSLLPMILTLSLALGRLLALAERLMLFLEPAPTDPPGGRLRRRLDRDQDGPAEDRPHADPDPLEAEVLLDSLEDGRGDPAAAQQEGLLPVGRPDREHDQAPADVPRGREALEAAPDQLLMPASPHLGGSRREEVHDFAALPFAFVFLATSIASKTTRTRISSATSV